MAKSSGTSVKGEIFGPTVLEGGLIGRIVEFADGSGRVETWVDGAWRAGGASPSEFFTGTEPSAARLKALGITAS